MGTKHKPTVVAGRPYFFNDDSPVCNFVMFFEPYLHQAGYSLPKVWLPFWFGLIVAFFMELFELLLRPCRGKRLVLLARAAVDTITTNLTFSDRRAREDL